MFSMVENSTDFDKILLGAIDEALIALGESSRQSIFFHIENEFKLNKNQIPLNLPRFQEGLEKIFGVGARFIEILIMKNLYSKIGRPMKMETSEQLEFINYVNAAKNSYLKK